MRAKALTIAALAALALAACGDTTSGPDWESIPNGEQLKQFIDEDAAAKACTALQETFDVQQDAAVLTYIDNAMKDAGCY